MARGRAPLEAGVQAGKQGPGTLDPLNDRLRPSLEDEGGLHSGRAPLGSEPRGQTPPPCSTCWDSVRPSLPPTGRQRKWTLGCAARRGTLGLGVSDEPEQSFCSLEAEWNHPEWQRGCSHTTPQPQRGHCPPTNTPGAPSCRLLSLTSWSPCGVQGIPEERSL